MFKNIMAAPVKAVLHLFLILSMAFFMGCSDDNGGSEDTGQIIINLTDAPGDFHNYVVTVKSLTLTKQNGVEVETLPVNSTIDFAEYTEMTEFFTIATIPAGRYVRAKLLLDYTQANIQVEDDSGAVVPVGDIVDSNNQAIQEMEVSVRLEGRNALTILPGVPAHLSLDFDLQASNQVDFAVSPPTLIVEPFLLADLQLNRQRDHRLRGLLAGVNTAESHFNVFVHPFIRRFANNDRPFGNLRVHTTDQTVFEIDEQVYEGQAGLAEMGNLTRLTKVISVGRIRLNPIRFEATEVYAGTSVPGGDRDGVRGTVSGRNGNVLTVIGATLIQGTGNVIFNQSIEVTVDDLTSVTKQASMDSVSIADINVGQRLTILGSVDQSNVNALTMDATGEQGHVRLLMSQITGQVSSVGANSLVMNLRSINGRSAAAIFDEATEADPTNFSVDTGNLDLGGLGNGIPVRLRGFLTAYEAQAAADFTAQTLLDISNLPAQVDVLWRQGSETPFSVLDYNGMTVDVSTADVGRVSQAGIGSVLTGNPTLLPVASNAIFIVKINDTISIHTQFEAFVDELNGQLVSPNAAYRVQAKGAYNYDTTTMDSRFIGVVIKSPANMIQ